MNAVLHWPGWREFVEMGGHAPYVWGAVGVFLAGLAAEALALRARRRALLRQLRWQREAGSRGHP
ncbi:heme exporter protein CcmD [Ideonella sp. YS5]|uniref:heme exporter protein CcmD n=1 Tax=Ideonella sp. YS5 TaxID=3453714 RepID=UPI003EEA56C6